MKIKISNECNGCGICLNEKNYIFEDEKGYAKEIEGILISPNDEKKIINISELCPCNAITIMNLTVDTNDTNKKTVLEDMVNELEKSLKEIFIPRLSHSNAPFKVEKYSFDFPSSSNEITTDYSSKLSAKSAAKNEFNNLVYCSSARNTQITKIMMDYKIKYGKQFYTLDDSSFYHITNKSIEVKLESFMNIVNDLGSFNIPNGWKVIKSLPNKKSLFYIHLVDYPKYDAPNDRIWKYVEDLGPTSLNDYVDYMDFDCFDWGDGGLLGMFAKKDWNYSGFDNAVDEFINDLIRAFDYYSDDIEESFYYSVNNVLDEYENDLRQEINNKISEIKKYLSL